jgi:extracellular matrix protein 14
MGLAKAIRTQSGERYEATSACEGTGFLSYPGASGSGSMLDYAYAVQDIPFTYQIKLRDTGNYGFLLPKTSIVPTGQEMLSMIRYLAQFLADDGSPKSVKPSEAEANTGPESVDLEL